MGLESVHMEAFAASPAPPVAECLERVKTCDALVILVAHCYGWVPTAAQGGDGTRSMTWLEVDCAHRHGIPVFPLMVEEDHDWAGPREQDRLHEVGPAEFENVGHAVHRLREFKQYLSEKTVRATFTTPESAGTRAATALSTWLLRQLPELGDPEPVPTRATPLEGSTVTVACGYELVAIPGGRFGMGSTSEEQERFAGENEAYLRRFRTEAPRQEIAIADFYMGRAPVTNSEYRRFLCEDGTAGIPDGWTAREIDPELPVVGLTWGGAQRFCDWAGLTLPTEAMWEYACRAGSTHAFWFGDDPDRLSEFAWFQGNAGDTLQQVRRKPANPLGLHDMHGNTWEWCRDWHCEYGGPIADDGTGERAASEGRGRVIRGGAYSSPARQCRAAYRFHQHPNNSTGTTGFRPALIPPR